MLALAIWVTRRGLQTDLEPRGSHGTCAGQIPRRNHVAALRRFLLSTSALMLTLTLPCAAQSGVEFAPIVGYYRPMQDLVAAPPAFPGLAEQQAVAVGGRLTVWLTRSLGVEAAFAYTDGSISGPWKVCFNGFATFQMPYYEFPSPGGQCPGVNYGPLGSFSASEWARIADLQLLFRFPIQSPTAQLSVGAGPAYVSHDGWATTSSPGAVVSAGMRMRITGTPLIIYLSAEDFLYTARYTVPPTTYNNLTFALDEPPPPGIGSAQFQSDFLVSAAVSVPIVFGGR